MNRSDIKNYEIDSFIDAVLFRYGYDFRHYARASLERRIMNRLDSSNLNNVSQMIPLILHNPEFFDLFLKDMSITVTEMFRDPSVFRTIRTVITEQLRTYSRLNIWVAGCATGEEAYSLAILLEEEGLLKRATIYATDYNSHAVEQAKNGVYSITQVKKFTKNYQLSGGTGSFADYCRADNDTAVMSDYLKKKITFANHNLVKDTKFAQMQLILCRNVLIYFDKILQDRVLSLFDESLIHRGFLVLGDKEKLDFTAVRDKFDEVSAKERIYRKKNYV